HLSLNVGRLLLQGVQIPGLGTFSFLREKLHIGSNKSIHLQRPVFLLSEKLAQIHGLKFNKIRIPGDIPIVQLNFIVLSLDSPFNREMVEGCVRETLLSFSRSIATKQTVEFTFKGIGVLIVRDNKVKMKFYKDFLHTMDGSGTLLKALTNRPGTVDSVVSSKDTPPFPTSNTAVFPRWVCFNNQSTNSLIYKFICRIRQASQVPKVLFQEAAGLSCFSLKTFHFSPKKLQILCLLCLQEMCYLCMQRAQRNIPVYLGEERRRKEKADDCILAQYQAIKDHEALQKELMKREQNREQNQKVASYNLGVAEAMRKQKNEKLVEPFRSFIFEKRPPSSTPHEKQEEYAQHLDKQLETKKARDAKQKQEQDFIDRLQQVQLAEELAAQRAKYLREKLEENQTYKTALDTQVNRLVANASITKQTVVNSRTTRILLALKPFGYSSRWIAEKGERMERLFQMNLAIQEDWRKSAGLKRQRDYEEKLFQRAGDKLMLLDQCARYRRCYQCKKGLNHFGKTNIWTDSKYIPGSRLIV
uniref:Coiled-coil domain containing 81 n=1 Tax=Pseudonaja textilis TaxID=8673 RepID=A0A670XRV4_PSETE